MVFHINHTLYDSVTKTWSGVTTKPLYDKNVSVAAVVFDSLSRNPSHIGQISDNSGVRLTNDQIRLNSIRLAINLQNGPLAVRKDHVISLMSRNNEMVSAIVFAAFALAAPINTLGSFLTPFEIVQMLQQTRPNLVFCEAENLDVVREALRTLDMDSTPLVTVDRKMENVHFIDDFLEPHKNERIFVPTDFEDGTKQTAIIVCSSGTTGPLKGVSISHAALLEQMSTNFYIKQDEVYLSFSSLHWISGIIALVASSIVGSTRIITTQTFEPELMLSLIEKYHVTMTLTVPFHLALLLQCPQIKNTNLSSLKTYYCGGSPVPVELKTKINKLLPMPIQIAYGMSELAGLISILDSGVRDSVGLLKTGIRVRIVDKKGHLCGPMTNGELLVKSQYPMLGYWGNEAATRDSSTIDGWFKTGDIGRFDQDGFLYLVDRKKDFIDYQNYYVSPSELENVVLRCPGVAQVCVVAIPDLVSTELPAAVIVRSMDKEASREDIESIVKDTLNDAHHLRGGVYFVSELPVTSTGKVLRRKVQEMAIEMHKQQNNSKSHHA